MTGIRPTARAYGRFVPVERAWQAPSGTMVDPFRPQIEPGGYRDVAELGRDRAYHVSCVRRSVEEMDVFVFTLGLIECWADAHDGAIFPIAPGGADHPDRLSHPAQRYLRRPACLDLEDLVQ